MSRNGTVTILPSVVAQRLQRAEDLLARQQLAYQEMLDQQDAKRGEPGLGFQTHMEQIRRQYLLVSQAEAEVERLRATLTPNEVDYQSAADLREELMTEYGRRGPHYRMLIDRAVAAEQRARELERSGGTVGVNEWRGAMKAVIEAVQALQRYTEAEKKEVLQEERRNAMLYVLEIAERVIAPRQPALWDEALTAIQEKLPTGAEVA